LRRLGLTTVALQDKRAVSRLLRKCKVDVVLAEYGSSAVSVMDACSEAAVPLVAHFHGWDAYSEYELKKNEVAYKNLFKQASAVIAVSSHMREQLLKLGASPEKTYYNSCGTAISSSIHANPDQAGKRFLMVGRLTEKKAPFLSILAFFQVLSRHSDARLDIIGDGSLRNVCIQLCRGLGIADQVVFHGAQPHGEVVNLLKQSRCFIQHSVHAIDGDHEGTPVGVLEAMGMGLPVVATRHGGIMDVIEDGVSGSLVDEFDINGMAIAMNKYADDPVLAQEVGKVARKLVLADWGSKKSVEKLWVIIKGAVKNAN
jgi:colanic acid/amylovoran biosynthesis glycosyltransferase